jgi:cellulose synthase/poly-beta-1,6-N-acetylglucosamine synthase-like glycosyltransferase
MQYAIFRCYYFLIFTHLYPNLFIMILFWYSVILFVTTLALNFYLLIGFKKIKQVSRQPIMDNPPPLAIIIAVRNEEEDLEKAMQSVCHINYTNHRVIVVNDRSTDRTAEILQGFSLQYPQLRVTTINTLPMDGWVKTTPCTRVTSAVPRNGYFLPMLISFSIPMLLIRLLAMRLSSSLII